MSHSPVGPCVGLAILLSFLAAGEAQTTICQKSVFVWEALPDTATTLQKIEMNREMESFCESFEDGEDFFNRGLNCRILFQSGSDFPSVAVWVPGCCGGTVASSLQSRFPNIRACNDLGPGESTPSLDVLIIAGDDTTDVGENTVGKGEDGQLYRGFVAEIGDGFRDWRFWLCFVLFLFCMLAACAGCLVWLCKKHKKAERDELYQNERNSRLLQTSRPRLSSGARDPLIQTPEPKDKPVASRRVPDVETADTPLVVAKGKQELEFSDSENEVYVRRSKELTTVPKEDPTP